jgi:hypothetical protein
MSRANETAQRRVRLAGGWSAYIRSWFHKRSHARGSVDSTKFVFRPMSIGTARPSSLKSFRTPALGPYRE